MPVTLGGKPNAGKWETVELTSGDTFDVFVKRPTFGAKMLDASLNVYGREAEFGEQRAENKIRSVVTDWRGVVDASGAPVPYSFEALTQLFEESGSAVYRLLNLAADLFFGLAETESKNLPEPSSVAPVVTAETATNAISESSTDTSTT